MLNQPSPLGQAPMSNGFSSLRIAHQNKHLEDLRKERAVLTQRIGDLDANVASLTAELEEIAAPYMVDARRKYRNALGTLLTALILGTGFVFFAEYSLKLIGFNWTKWQLFAAGIVFWLGTVVTIHIYLSSLRKTDFSSLPLFFRLVPLVLIILGVIVLALARGLSAFSVGSNNSDFATLARLASWSGLIAQVTLSLGLDLGSGVVGWAGIAGFNIAQPIWRRYQEIDHLDNLISQLKDSLVTLEAELSGPAQSPKPPSPQPPGTEGVKTPAVETFDEDEKPRAEARAAG